MVDLPPVPDRVRREISEIATRDGRPMFRIVDGQRELKWRNGKYDVKHLLQHQNVPAYVPVATQIFRRAYKEPLPGDITHKLYPTRASASADTDDRLDADIEFTTHVSTRAVGRACWIVEVYVSPDEIGYKEWEANRYADLQKHGVVRRVDVLGPFPREGMYMFCFPVLDSEGKAIAPNQQTIDECKRLWRIAEGGQQSVEQAVRDHEERIRKFEQKEVERLADNIY